MESIFIVSAAVVLGMVPASVALRKGRSFVPWWLYGTLAFVVAMPHALIMAPVEPTLIDGMRRCPSCREWIRSDARSCDHCGQNIAR